jgi:hypothetical protein
MTNLGASMGTALAGSLMISAVSAGFLTNIQQNPSIPNRIKEDATVKLAGGVPFISDADFNAALDEAGVRNKTSEDALAAYQDARIDGLKTSLGILAVLALVGLLYSGRIPSRQPQGGGVPVEDDT